VLADVMLPSVTRTDVDAAVLRAERKQLEHILKARQLRGHRDVEGVSADAIDSISRIAAHQHGPTIDQTRHSKVVALDRRLDSNDAVAVGEVDRIDRELLRRKTLELSRGRVRFSVQRDLEVFRGVAGPRSLDAEIRNIDVGRIGKLERSLNEPG